MTKKVLGRKQHRKRVRTGNFGTAFAQFSLASGLSFGVNVDEIKRMWN